MHTVFYEKRRDFSLFFINFFNKVLLGPWKTVCISIHLVFHVHKNVFNHVKVRALLWPWKGNNLMYTCVDFGKYLFVKSCIGMFGDELLTFFPSLAFAP